MELIPILSTIILVATISTFLLAIGAYVLYKVRERKGQAAAAPVPATVKGELVTPAEAPIQIAEQPRMAPQPLFVEQPIYQVERQPVFVQQPAGRPTQQRYTPQPRSYNEGGFAEKSYAPKTEKTSDKFLKYTTEGYVSAKEDKDSGALRWK